jgi:hypothetical protein
VENFFGEFYSVLSKEKQKEIIYWYQTCGEALIHLLGTISYEDWVGPGPLRFNLMKLKNDNSELKEEIVEIICRQVCASLGDEMVESIIQKYIQGPQDLQKEILFKAGREKERFNRIRMRINSK